MKRSETPLLFAVFLPVLAVSSVRELLIRISGWGLGTVTELSGVALPALAAAPSGTGTEQQRYPSPVSSKEPSGFGSRFSAPLAEGERYGRARR